jgi:hypothetical protein
VGVGVEELEVGVGVTLLVVGVGTALDVLGVGVGVALVVVGAGLVQMGVGVGRGLRPGPVRADEAADNAPATIKAAVAMAMSELSRSGRRERERRGRMWGALRVSDPAPVVGGVLLPAYTSSAETNTN